MVSHVVSHVTWCHTSMLMRISFSVMSSSSSRILSSDSGAVRTAADDADAAARVTSRSRSLRSSGSGLPVVSGSFHETTPAEKDRKPKTRNCAFG